MIFVPLRKTIFWHSVNQLCTATTQIVHIGSICTAILKNCSTFISLVPERFRSHYDTKSYPIHHVPLSTQQFSRREIAPKEDVFMCEQKAYSVLFWCRHKNLFSRVWTRLLYSRNLRRTITSSFLFYRVISHKKNLQWIISFLSLHIRTTLPPISFHLSPLLCE